jgi:hypothetical protein
MTTYCAPGDDPSQRRADFRRARPLLCAAVLLYSLAAAKVQAAPSRWLEVTPGLSCLSAERLEAQVAMWLGRPNVRTTARVQARGDAQHARTVELLIELDGATSVRRFDPLPASCDEAHAAVSLVLALAIEPEVMSSVLPIEREPSEPVDVALTAQLASASALLPSWSLGAAIGAEAWWLPWLGARVEIFAQHARNNIVTGTSGEFDATLVAGDLRGCAGGKPSRGTRLALCTGAALGALHARGRSYERSYAPTGLWLGIMSGLRFEVDAGVPLLLDVTAVLPLRAQPFTVARAGDGEAVEQPSPAAVLVALGAKLPL